PTSSRGPGSSFNTRKPAVISAKGRASPAAGAAGPCTPLTRTPDASATTAITAKTVPGPLKPRITPASAGASSTLRLSIQPETTFVAVSSSGGRASAGVNADWVGRVIVTAVAATAASAYARYGMSATNSTVAVAPIEAACAT